MDMYEYQEGFLNKPLIELFFCKSLEELLLELQNKNKHESLKEFLQEYPVHMEIRETYQQEFPMEFIE